MVMTALSDYTRTTTEDLLTQAICCGFTLGQDQDVTSGIIPLVS